MEEKICVEIDKELFEKYQETISKDKKSLEVLIELLMKKTINNKSTDWIVAPIAGEVKTKTKKRVVQ